MVDFLGYALGGALCVGASVVPSLIFSGLVFQNAGAYAFLLPVVMLIVAEKSSIFLVHAFGGIRNPGKILVASLGIGIAGTVITLLGAFWNALWAVGAAVLGCGMAVYAPMFRTFRDGKKRAGTWESNASTPASYLVLVLIVAGVFALFYALRLGLEVVLGFYLCLLVLEFAFLVPKWRAEPDARERMFEAGGRAPHAVLYTVVAVAATLVVCLTVYSRTVDSLHALLILVAYTVLIVAYVLLHRDPLRGHAHRTFWYGMVRTFFNTFSLFYFTVTGQVQLVFVGYIVYGLGIGLSKVAAVPMKRLLHGAAYERFCIVAALASSCLLFTFSPVPYFIGMGLGTMFVSAGNSNSAHIYLDDASYPFNERHLVRAKYFATGAIMGQGVLMVVLLVVGLAMQLGGGDVMAVLEAPQESAAVTWAFGWTLAACLVTFAAIIAPQVVGHRGAGHGSAAGSGGSE